MTSARIESLFASLKREKRGGLGVFVTAGDPDFSASAAILTRLARQGSGADLLEIGWPFSDPVADGPVIQAANERALGSGLNRERFFALVRRARAANRAIPIILMGYSNPALTMGEENFAAAAEEAGADGVILVDLPPEEAQSTAQALRARKLDLVHLIAPTTPPERAQWISQSASGFLYYVAVTGVTGVKKASPAALAQAMKTLRATTLLPLAAGFGISEPEDVRRVWQSADLAVVGSALVRRIAQAQQKGADPAQAAADFTARLASG